MSDPINEAYQAILRKVPPILSQPKVAIVCGSGLGGIVDGLRKSPRYEIPFASIPGFSASTVEGHAGKLVVGYLGEGKVPVICMSGRLHTYEGLDVQTTTLPIRAFQLLGVQVIVTTNAAGSLNPNFSVGDLMVLNDHLNLPGLAGLNPLRGPNDPALGPRFLAIADAYDHELRHRFFKSAAKLGIKRPIHEGVYAYVSGPTYETWAENRFLQAAGADAVGMSTVPEVIVARHGGIRVLAVSLITNKSRLDKVASAKSDPVAPELTKLTHDEVVAAASEAADDIQKLVLDLIADL